MAAFLVCYLLFLLKNSILQCLSVDDVHVRAVRGLSAGYDKVTALHLARQEIHHPSGLIYKVMSLLQKSRVLIACHSKENSA